jgi:hypothetical protein
MGKFASWLYEACAPGIDRTPRIERLAVDGRRAALVEVPGGAGLASHVRVATDEAGAWREVAVFDGRVEAMEWQGADLLLAFPAGHPRRVFSLYPGLRLREAIGPGGLRWVRLSTRRSLR